MSVQVRWVEEEEALAEAGRWIGARVSLDPAYISHGEIQQALSPDGAAWAHDAVARIEDEARRIAASGGHGALAEARGADGARLGAAIAWWELGAPAPHVVIGDLVVEPGARGRGVGKALVDFILAAAKARKIGWAFLESGLANARAHDFFEREGFKPASKVFARRL